MKKAYFLLPVFILLITARPIQAETQTPVDTTNRGERIEVREARVTERMGKIEEKKENREARVTDRMGKVEEKKEDRQARRSEIAENHAERLEKRFGAYTQRLTTLSEKIQTRIDAVKAQGNDTASSQEKLDSGLAALTSARSYADQSVAQFRAIDPEKFEEQKSEAQAARELADKAREGYKNALELFRSAVKELK